MSVLLELAERCEQATGPSFRLEQEIWAAAVANPPANLGSLGNIKPPAYTASLDAAMSLVPEGFDYAVGKGITTELGDVATIYAWVGEGEGPLIWGATPALALCAAAVRARAAQEVGQ